MRRTSSKIISIQSSDKCGSRMYIAGEGGHPHIPGRDQPGEKQVLLALAGGPYLVMFVLVAMVFYYFFRFPSFSVMRRSDTRRPPYRETSQYSMTALS